MTPAEETTGEDVAGEDVKGEDTTATGEDVDGAETAGEDGEVGDVSDEEIIDSLNSGIVIDAVSKNAYKTAANANPISPSVFCADPTAVEYEGRLYVYATNDHEQSEEDTTNDYDHIDSLVVFSTEDMVNWVYHGRIEVGELCPWCNTSWAPSVISRVEDDGLTHFYLYFSNNGAGVGVITSTDPVTGWTDPLGAPLVYQNMPGLKNCPAPFDPGVCIDDNGVGWLTFGGGSSCTEVHSNIPKIVKLGDDLLSFDSDFVSIDAPYFFEASEINYIDGVYYYTYCNDWQNRNATWDYEGAKRPDRCSMGYLTSTDPLNADSWVYRGDYFYNSGQNATGESGLRWGNNHTHFCEYKGTNYILHHTLLLEELQRGSAGFRSLMVDYLPMNPETQEIPKTAATRKGVAQVEAVNAYEENDGALMFTSADVFYEKVANPAAKSMAAGAWTMVKGVDFEYGAENFIANVKGTGRIEVRLDDVDNEAVSYIEFDNADFKKVRSTEFKAFDGRLHNVFFVFSGEGIEFDSFTFTKGEETARAEEDLSVTDVNASLLTFNGQVENPSSAMKANLEYTKSGEYSVQSSVFDENSEMINLGFINEDKKANYTVTVKSLTLETADGDVEIPVNKTLDPKTSNNGLANGWGSNKIGSLIYGSDEKGLFAEKSTISWANFRIALKIDGKEVKYTSVTYNIDLEVSDMPVETEEPEDTKAPSETKKPAATENPAETVAPSDSNAAENSANPGDASTPSNNVSPNVSSDGNAAAGASTSSSVTGKPATAAGVAPGTTQTGQVTKPSKVKLNKAKSTKKKCLNVTWTKLEKVDGYQIFISTDKKFKKGKKIFKVKNVNKKLIKKLKSKKVYFVKVRGFIKDGESTIYGAFSKVKKARVK
ncbi:MAG: family 43 glycosylhydrolase [Lachnospiraceae bacterium]|nr:family 43 glycosylhydrolase [Lachnospiraceae bacterium]